MKESSFWSSYQKGFEGQAMPDVNSNVTLIKGFVEETFPAFWREQGTDSPVLLIHLDMDVYEPTKVVLDWVAGTDKKVFVLFDELLNYEEFHLHEYRAFLETILHNDVPYKVRSLCDKGRQDYGALGKVCIEVR